MPALLPGDRTLAPDGLAFGLEELVVEDTVVDVDAS